MHRISQLLPRFKLRGRFQCSIVHVSSRNREVLQHAPYQCRCVIAPILQRLTAGIAKKSAFSQLKRGSVKIISAYAKYMYPVPHADDEGIDCPKEERITASANNRRRKNPKRRGRKSTNAPEVFPPAHGFSSTYRLGRVLQICVAAGIKPARSLASHQTSHQKLLDTRSSGQREK